MDRTQNRNKPADVIRDGSLKATIWENDGEKGPYHTTQLAKTYEDREGKLRDTTSFSSGDLLRISELARQAYTRTTELRREFRQSHNQSRDDQDNHARDTKRDSHRERRSSTRRASRRDNSRDESSHPEPGR